MFGRLAMVGATRLNESAYLLRKSGENVSENKTVNGFIESNPAKEIANLIMNDLKGLLKKHKLKIEQCPLKPEVIGFLGRAISTNSLTKKQAKTLMAKWFEENLEENGKEKDSHDDNNNDNGNDNIGGQT